MLKIVRMGNPVLLKRAEPVADARAPELRGLAADMIETMIEAGGVGLAAPQVGRSLRLFVFRVPEDRLDPAEVEERPVPVTVLVNPEVEALGDETEVAVEGCLSIPGLVGAVERPVHIRYRGLTLDGEWIEREARGGLHARVVQHEYDHLEGVLFPMRLSDAALFGFREEIEAAIAAARQPEETCA